MREKKKKEPAVQQQLSQLTKHFNVLFGIVENVTERLREKPDAFLSVCGEDLRARAKLWEMVERCRMDSDVYAYAYRTTGGQPLGLLVMEMHTGRWAQVVVLVVEEAYRRRGIAGKLIDCVAADQCPTAVTADADDFIVDFYREKGFATYYLWDDTMGISRFFCCKTCEPPILRGGPYADDIPG